MTIWVCSSFSIGYCCLSTVRKSVWLYGSVLFSPRQFNVSVHCVRNCLTLWASTSFSIEADCLSTVWDTVCLCGFVLVSPKKLNVSVCSLWEKLFDFVGLYWFLHRSWISVHYEWNCLTLWVYTGFFIEAECLSTMRENVWLCAPVLIFPKNLNVCPSWKKISLYGPVLISSKKLNVCPLWEKLSDCVGQY
jgi:hypothetical protein